MAYDPFAALPPVPGSLEEDPTLPPSTRRALRPPLPPATPVLPEPIAPPPETEPQIQVQTALSRMPSAVPTPGIAAPAPPPRRAALSAATLATPATVAPAEEAPAPDYQAIIDEAEKDFQAAQKGDWMAGLSGGWETTKGLVKYAVAAGAGGLGFEETAEDLARSAMQNEREAQRYAQGRPVSLEDIDSAGDTIDWLQYHLGSFVPTIAETAGAALIGGIMGAATGPGAVATAAGGAVAKSGLRKLLQDYVRKQVGKNARDALVKDLGKDAGGKLADKITKGIALSSTEAAAAKGAQALANRAVARDIGRALGAFGASYQMGVGDLYGETVDEEGEGGNAGLAFTLALPYGALESLMPLMLMGKMKGGVDPGAHLKDFAKSIAKEGVRMGRTEAATEAIQESLVMGAGIIDDNKDYGTWGDIGMSLANAAAVGAATGFILGAPGGARRRVSDPENPDPLEIHNLIEPTILQQNLEQGGPPVGEDGLVDIQAAAGAIAQRLAEIRAQHGDSVADAAEAEWTDILARGGNQAEELHRKRIAEGELAWERVGGIKAKRKRDPAILQASDRDLLAAYAFGTEWRRIHRQLPQDRQQPDLLNQVQQSRRAMLTELMRRRSISNMRDTEQARMRKFFDHGMTPEEAQEELFAAATPTEAEIASANLEQAQIERRKEEMGREQEEIANRERIQKERAERREEQRKAAKAARTGQIPLPTQTAVAPPAAAELTARRGAAAAPEAVAPEPAAAPAEEVAAEAPPAEAAPTLEPEPVAQPPTTVPPVEEIEGAVSEPEAARPDGGVPEPGYPSETQAGGETVPAAERGEGIPEGGRAEQPPPAEGEEAGAPAEAAPTLEQPESIEEEAREEERPPEEAPSAEERAKEEPALEPLRYERGKDKGKPKSWATVGYARRARTKAGFGKEAKIIEVDGRYQVHAPVKEEPAAAKAETPPTPKINRGSFAPLDPEVDSLLAAIAKRGGINLESIASSHKKASEIDTPDFNKRYGIRPIFRKTEGMTLDGMAEELSQYGYPLTGEAGAYDQNVLLDLIRQELSGKPVYSQRADYDLIGPRREPEYADTLEDSEAIAQEIAEGAEAESDIFKGLADARLRAEKVLGVEETNRVEEEFFFSAPSISNDELNTQLIEVFNNAADRGSREGARARAEGEAETLTLEGETAAELEARRRTEEAERKKERERIAAEEEAGRVFVLSGSDRDLDQAEARGQINLFDVGGAKVSVAGPRASIAAARRGEAPLTREFLQAKANVWTKDWKGIKKVNVVQEQEDMPALAQQKIQAFIDAGIPDPKIRGLVMPDGSAYLVAGNMHSLEEALKVLIHEGKGHVGVQGIFGNRLNGVLDQIIEEFPHRVRAVADARKLDITDKAQHREAAEEMLAILAETHEAPHILKRAYIAIRQWLRAHGINLRLTDADIDAILMAAGRYVEQGPEGYRRTRRWPVLGEPLPGREGPWKLIEEGVAEPEEAYQAAQRIPDIPRTQEFRNWFRESEVVDDNGLPKVVYHGTPAEFWAFREKYPGRPFFFAQDQEVADEFARRSALRGDDAPPMRIMPVYLSAQKVWDFRKPEHVALALDWVKEHADPAKLGMWSKPKDLLRAVLLGNFDAIEDPDFQRDVIKGNGFDGFTVTEMPGGPVNYAVYEPTQIKSAIHNVGTYDPTNPDIRFSLHGDLKDLVLGRKSRGKSNSPFHEQNERIRENDRPRWDLVKRYLRRQLAPGGLLSLPHLRPIFNEMIKRDSKFGVQEMDINNLIVHLEDAVKKEWGKSFGDLSEQQILDLDQAIRGEIPDGMPRLIADSALAMRQYIDKDSAEYAGILFDQAQQLKAEGKEEGAAQRAGLLEVIASNIGKYINRSFKVFDDPKWFTNVPTEVLDNARAYIADERNARAAKLEDWARKARQRATTVGNPQEELDKAQKHEERAAELRDPERVEAMINAILKAGTAYSDLESFAKEAMISEPKLGAKDLSILIKRKQIAEPILALLGEHKDPRVNFSKTATKMGRLIENQRFLDKVKEIGYGQFLFDRQEDEFGATVQIGTGDRYSPIDGLWTHPEVELAFRDALKREEMPDWYRFVVQVNGAIKFGKTVVSPTTVLRNWMSAFLFTMANGHFNMKYMGEAFRAMSEHVHAKDKGKFFQYLRHLKEIGVVYDTPYAGEMFRLLEESRIEDMFAGNARMTFKRLINVAQRFYQFGDDFWKIIGFENEKRLLMRYKKLSESEAEIQAAERIRNTYPTYSMTGRFVNQLRRFPLVGTFVSFPAEIIRTTGNMFRYLAADMRDPDLRPLAMRRIAGLAIAAGSAHALQAIFTTMLGVDDEEEEAIRDMAAPWQKNSNILPVGRDEDGNLRYIDMSFMDPYNYWKRPINAILRDEPWEEKAREIAREVFEPFFGADIAAGAIWQAMANRKETGGTVYNPYDTVPAQLSDILGHIAKQVQPGATALAGRYWNALDGKISPSGKVYSKFDETAAAFGFRITTHSPKTALYFKSYEFRDGKRNATKILSDVARNPNKVSERELKSAYTRAMRARNKAYREMGRIVLAGRLSGLTNQQVSAVLRGSGISQEDTQWLMRLQMPPWRPSKQFLRNAAKKAEVLFGEEQVRALQERREFIEAMQ